MLDDNPPEPSGKSSRFPKLVEMQIGIHECLLRSILSPTVISKPGKRPPVGRVLEPMDNRVERILIASLCGPDYVSQLIQTFPS